MIRGSAKYIPRNSNFLLILKFFLILRSIDSLKIPQRSGGFHISDILKLNNETKSDLSNDTIEHINHHPSHQHHHLAGPTQAALHPHYPQQSQHHYHHYQMLPENIYGNTSASPTYSNTMFTESQHYHHMFPATARSWHFENNNNPNSANGKYCE